MGVTSHLAVMADIFTISSATALLYNAIANKINDGKTETPLPYH